MRILVCEFVTGGGMPPDQPIPAGLAAEGDVMLRALLDDLLEIPGVEPLVTRDARLNPPLNPPPRVSSITVSGPPECWPLWEELARAADAVWPIAPESDGALERFSRMVEAVGRPLLNSGSAAVAIAASKTATAGVLAAAALPVAPVWGVETVEAPPGDGPWVVKPDDGAGCVDTLLLRDRADWDRWRAADRSGFVVQPFVPGEPASLSMLCRDGRARLLAVNRQRVDLSGSVFAGHGVIAGGLPATPDLVRLADGIAAALPGLFGYAGVDFIATPQGPVVLEVNPRLTTAYAGLRHATGRNVAAEVLELARGPGEGTGGVPSPPWGEGIGGPYGGPRDGA